MKIRRDVILIILIPLLFVASIRFIMALTLTQEELEEKITFYDVDYVPSDYSLTDIRVQYISVDEMQVDFKINGGDGQEDLEFVVYCQDLDHVRLVSSSTASGTLSLLGLNSQSFETYSMNYGDEIGGSLIWEDIPSGDQIVRLNVQLENIYLDTWTFYIELRNK